MSVTLIISCHGRGTPWTWATTESWRIRHAMVTKGSMLPAEEHLGRWVERNCASSPLIAEACDRAGMVHDLSASQQIAAWAYEQAAASGGALWRGAGCPRYDNG